MTVRETRAKSACNWYRMEVNCIKSLTCPGEVLALVWSDPVTGLFVKSGRRGALGRSGNCPVVWHCRIVSVRGLTFPRSQGRKCVVTYVVLQSGSVCEQQGGMDNVVSPWRYA